MDAAIIGFGTVGRAFARKAAEKAQSLKGRHSLDLRIIGVYDPKFGSAFDPSGLNPMELLRALEAGGRLSECGRGDRGLTGLDMIRSPDVDLVIELTHTDLRRGEPGLTHLREALGLGKDVITTNKGPLALAYWELRDLAERKGAFLGFEGTVLSGTPAINLAQLCIEPAEVVSLEGVLNGTTNFILSSMEAGESFEEALSSAIRMGFAEADPSNDIDGLDAAAKVTILANSVMGGRLRFEDVEVSGIRGIGKGDVSRSLSNGKRIKLLARAWRDGAAIRAWVGPAEIDQSNPLAMAEGITNALTYHLDVGYSVTIMGPGAGGDSAAMAVMSDLIRLAHFRRANPR
jgi:homoserine dehydrogenase